MRISDERRSEVCLRLRDALRARPTVADRQIVPAADGTVRVVIAHDDPGVPNWLDTAGHREGPIVFFWLRARARLEPIEARVVAMAKLSGPDT